MKSESIFCTTFKLFLPIGLVDANGIIHQEGLIRLTTGEDELYLQKDSRILDNPAYGLLVILSRVILSIGNIPTLTPEILEGLFLPDLNYLQEVYNQINPPEAALSLSGE